MLGNCILLISGLPASGKSALVNELLYLVQSDAASVLEDDPFYTDCDLPWKVISILYDHLIPLEVQQEMVKRQDDWKKARHEILAASETFLINLMHGKDSEALYENEYHERISEANKDVEPNQMHLVVVEDNLYYSSMRYSWHQIARKLSAGFCQVWLDCPLAELQVRNALRLQKVPSEVIKTMSTRQEPPDPEKNPWERHSLLIDTLNRDRKQIIRDVCGLVVRASADPEKPVQSPEKAKEMFTPNDANMVDQILRKIVSSKIRAAKGTGVDLTSYAKDVNSRRVSVLEKLRSGAVEVPHSFKEDVERMHTFVLNLYLKEECIL